MSNSSQDWEEFARSVSDIVERAISSQNYQKLNQTVNRAAKAGSDALKRAAESVNQSRYSSPASNYRTPGSSGQNYTRSYTKPPQSPVQDAKSNLPALYDRSSGKMIGGILKTVGGAFLIFGGVLPFLARAAISIVTGTAIGIFPFVILGAGVVCGSVLLGGGIGGLNRLSRFRQYVKYLGDKTHCSIELLAQRVRKSPKFVRRDLKKMISDGLFFEGHLDAEGNTLITSHETYQLYEENRKLLEQKQAEAQQKAKEMEGQPELQELLRRGSDFLQEIRFCNDAIPGEEISRKISRMESIIENIFDCAEKHPEVIPDLKKLMDYYLPITVKLLHAYADMDRQSVEGETIAASKREIEGTLDTLNTAYEKLLDSVFKETAMDVSSDISVLNTLLAREGLTDDGLINNKSET